MKTRAYFPGVSLCSTSSLTNRPSSKIPWRVSQSSPVHHPNKLAPQREWFDVLSPSLHQLNEQKDHFRCRHLELTRSHAFSTHSQSVHLEKGQRCLQLGSLNLDPITSQSSQHSFFHENGFMLSTRSKKFSLNLNFCIILHPNNRPTHLTKQTKPSETVSPYGHDPQYSLFGPHDWESISRNSSLCLSENIVQSQLE